MSIFINLSFTDQISIFMTHITTVNYNLTIVLCTFNFQQAPIYLSFLSTVPPAYPIVSFPGSLNLEKSHLIIGRLQTASEVLREMLTTGYKKVVKFFCDCMGHRTTEKKT